MNKPELNPEQLKAASHVTGPLLVLAGAGSGKTRVLTERIVHLIKDESVRPYRILAVTFTNKACEEMRERLRQRLGNSAEEIWISTFHSAGLRILRASARHFSIPSDFVIYDADDTKKLLKSILIELEIDPREHPPEHYAREIDQAKNALITAEEFEVQSERSERASVKEVYQAYERALMRSNAFDFGDLIMKAVLLLEQNPSVLERYRDQLQHILVDEFQDTNLAQFRLVEMLAAKHRNLFVVGDDDQSIYRFRGATVRNILEFEKHYPEAQVVTLEQNYRSTGNILEAANSVISGNPDRRPKKLWTSSSSGDPIEVAACEDDDDEAYWVVRSIESQLDQGLTPAEIAVLYRTNAQSRAFEEALVRSGIPYRIYGGLKFYERLEVKDLIAYLRLIINPDDEQAFSRIVNTPPRGIGAQSEQRIREAARMQGVSPFRAASEGAFPTAVKGFVTLIESLQGRMHKEDLPALIASIARESGYLERLRTRPDEKSEGRIENLEELAGIARRMSDPKLSTKENLRLFLDRASLTAGDERPEEGDAQRKGAVSLMTLHLAKGLEFRAVFLAGFEEGLLPHARSIFNPEELSEERRLCYVGLTRARERLFLTRAHKRYRFGSAMNTGSGGLYREPSRFAKDLPVERVLDEGGDFFSVNIWSDDSLEPDLEFIEYEEQVKKESGKAKWKTSPEGGNILLRSASDLALEREQDLADEFKPDEVEPGLAVRHKQFGVGTVTKIEGEGVRRWVSVKFEGISREKKLLLQHAHFAKI